MIRSTLPTPVRRAPLLAVASALVLLAGCGGTGGAKTVTVGAGAPTGAATTRAGGGSAAAADGRPAPTRTDTVIASRTGAIATEPVLLQIVEFRRSRTTVALSLRLSTTVDENVTIRDTFDNGLEDKSTGGEASTSANSMDGIYLVDGDHGRRYLVGRDAQNHCACDTGLGLQALGKDAPVNLSAIFGAPPPSVKTVDVFIPRFGTFKDLPLG